jgi:hypothetical protein
VHPFEITLVESDGPTTPNPARLISFEAQPITARSEQRVEARLRVLASELASNYSHVEWAETLCRVEEAPRQTRLVPGILLLDIRFAILIALYDRTAVVSIPADAVSRLPQRRYKAALAHLEALSSLGYMKVAAPLTDDRGLGEELSAVIARAQYAEHRDWLTRIRSDSRVWFVSIFVTIGVAAGITRYLTGGDESLLVGAALGLFSATTFTAFQYRYETSLAVERMRRLRDEIAVPREASQLWQFDVRRDWWGLALSTAVFAGFAVASFTEPFWLGVFVMGGAFVAFGGRELLSWRADVVLDARGVEGLGLRGRSRIPYHDIDAIAQGGPFGLRFVQSANHGTIWIPSTVRAVDQLVETLVARVVECRGQSVFAVRSDAELIRGIRSELASARHRFAFKYLPIDHRRRPLWLMFIRHHPLWPQFSYQRQLRNRGRVVLAHIIAAHPALSQDLPATTHVTAPALVVFSPDSQWDGLRLLSETISAMFEEQSGHGETAAEIESFKAALGRNAGFPLWVLVPTSLTGGAEAYCTSLVIASRDLPLGRLCSQWMPILVDPQCRFAIAVPIRQWGVHARRQWKTGAHERSHVPMESAIRGVEGSGGETEATGSTPP